MNVAVTVAASYAVVPATTWLAALRSSITTDEPVTGSLKDTDGRMPTGTPVAPTAGVRPVTVGGRSSWALSAKTTSTQ